MRQNTILGIERFTSTPKRVVVTGAHPGDPEAGCGGLIALLTKAGHKVTLCYFTTGEAGIEGASFDEAASIRKKESIASSELLGATPYYFGQIDGNSLINISEYNRMLLFLEEEKPDLLLTHWPLDTHIDHRSCAMVTYDAWLRLSAKPDLYYYEVTPGGQTQNFIPTDYANIIDTVQLKRKACFLHESQNMEELYPKDHELMEEFRGMESGFKYAEAFVRQKSNPQIFLK